MPTGCAGHFGRQNERSGALFAVIALYLQNFRYILKKSLESRLPRSVLRRSKSGFGVPLRQWIKCELREMVADLLSKARVHQRGLFRWEAIEAMRREVDRGSGDYAYLLWALLTLEIWQSTFLDSAGICSQVLAYDEISA